MVGSSGSGGPDLTVSGVSLGDYSGEAGDNFSISYTRENIGDADAGSFDLSIRFSDNITISTSDDEACHSTISGMTAGTSSSTGITTCTVPSVSGGDYYVGVIMDTDDDVSESNESNNTDYDSNRFSVSSCSESDYWDPSSMSDSDEGAQADGSTYGTGNGTTLEVEFQDDGGGDVEFQVCKAGGYFSGNDIWVIFDETELGMGVVFEAAVATSSSSSCTSWYAIDTSAWSEGDYFGGNMHIESPSSSGATWGSGCTDQGGTSGDCWFMGSFGTMERTCL